MEYLFVVFILIIVIATGYVLSKPFTRKEVEQEEAPVLDREAQYQKRLEEIKAIGREWKAGTLPEDECTNQIREKKEKAADLLRLINSEMEPEWTASENIEGAESVSNPTMTNLPAQDLHHCPLCGDQVMLSDKFCMHCGHRLKP